MLCEDDRPSGDRAGGALSAACMMSRRGAVLGRGRDWVWLYCLTQMAVMVSLTMVN